MTNAGELGEDVLETDKRVDQNPEDFFRDRYVKVPDIIAEWVAPYGSAEGGNVLDFGCGEGVCALGFATRYSPRRVVGVDISSDIDRCLPLAGRHIGSSQLPANLQLLKIEPGVLPAFDCEFDLIYSWSVFEHIDQRILDETLPMLGEALSANGVVFLQVSPLYYSPQGSHLCHLVPGDWARLIHQNSIYAEMLQSSRGPEDFECIWEFYQTLNKMTASRLIKLVEDAGFFVLRQLTTRSDVQPDASLLEIYKEDTLLTDQIVILATRSQHWIDVELRRRRQERRRLSGALGRSLREAAKRIGIAPTKRSNGQ